MSAELQAYQIGGDSIEIAATTSPSGTALPSLDATEPLKYVYVNVEGGDLAVVKPGLAADSVTVATGLHVPEFGAPVVLNVTGQTHLLHVTAAGTATIHVTPLANS